MTGPVEIRIRERLSDLFEPDYLEVENESDKHGVPDGGETHFRVLVVSPRFDGLSRVVRQRMVNDALAEELKAGVHALAQRALTPEEWDIQQNAEFASPPCMGGSKHEK